MQGSDFVLKRIDSNNKVFQSSEFQKDKYKFFLILQNLNNDDLELYSDEENYVLCRSGKKWQRMIHICQN